MLLVLDCSTVMAWCFEDECDAYADAALEALENDVGRVPAIWECEVANVLLVAERRGRLSAAGASRFVDLLADLPIEVDCAEPGRILSTTLAVGRTYRLSSYDAAYLDLAMRTGAAMATRDKALREACRKAGVSLFGQAGGR